MQTRAFLVLGYNNTRIDDVRKIRAKAQAHFGALTVLCKPKLTPEDLASADHAIDLSLDPTPQNVSQLLKTIKDLGLTVLGVLPFSDPGTQLAAHICRELGLPGSDPALISAALSKVDFRLAENSGEAYPARYTPVRFEKISSKDELIRFFEASPTGAFVKPAKEGNSRGCTVLRTMADVERAWKELEPYYAGGLIVEENVTGGQEYSFDHVHGASWITEKQTTQNEYRAEIQQIVPAPLPAATGAALTSAGRFVAEISGSQGGACHNELFWVARLDSAVAVEPNLRPGGMRIWDLAALAFENFDPWLEWLAWASNTPRAAALPLKRRAHAGIRMIAAPANGRLASLPSTELEALRARFPGLLEIKWTKTPGADLVAQPKDNAGFVGFVVASHPDYGVLADTLKGAAELLSAEVVLQ